MSNKEAIRKLIGLLAKYKKTIGIIIICLLVSTGLNLCIPLLSKNIMDQGFIGGNKKLLVELVLISFAAYIIMLTIDIFKEKKRIDISADIEYTLSEQSFLHLMRLKIDYFTKTNYAEILNNITLDISTMTSIADEGMFFVVTQIFSITGGVVGLCIINYKLTLLVLLFIPIKYFIIKYFAKKRKKLMNIFIEESQKYASWFGDSIGGIHEVKLFRIWKEKYHEFTHRQRAVIENKKKMSMLGQWNMGADRALLQSLQVIIYIIGANMVFHLELSVGSIFAFITYSSYVTAPISAILNIGYHLSGILPSTKRFYEFMGKEEEGEGEDAGETPESGDIELKNISFSYEKGKEVLKNVSFRIAKGSKTALIGRNGSGKSTIIDLLLRMYEPDKGEILLNQKNILNFSLGEYRKIFSIVSQQIYLFNQTIRHNICLYQEVTEEKLAQAVKNSGLGEFVGRVGLEYMVGENGAMLSGGQKQKIAMARALVHDKPIIIFDEATSNADAKSEMQINQILQSELKEKTIIIVSHKQEILSVADNIAFVDNAEVQQGTYEELYQNSVKFREMVYLR